MVDEPRRKFIVKCCEISVFSIHFSLNELLSLPLLYWFCDVVEAEKFSAPSQSWAFRS